MWARSIRSKRVTQSQKVFLIFLWVYWLCFQNNEYHIVAYVCVIILIWWVSFHMWPANIKLTPLNGLNIQERFSVWKLTTGSRQESFMLKLSALEKNFHLWFQLNINKPGVKQSFRFLPLLQFMKIKFLEQRYFLNLNSNPWFFGHS